MRRRQYVSKQCNVISLLICLRQCCACLFASFSFRSSPFEGQFPFEKPPGCKFSAGLNVNLRALILRHVLAQVDFFHYDRALSRRLLCTAQGKDLLGRPGAFSWHRRRRQHFRLENNVQIKIYVVNTNWLFYLIWRGKRQCGALCFVLKCCSWCICRFWRCCCIFARAVLPRARFFLLVCFGNLVSFFLVGRRRFLLRI